MKTLSERLVFARKRTGMTQVEVAEKVGITQPSLQQLESGKSKTTAHAYEIARVLGVSFDWLKSGKGLMLDQTGLASDTARTLFVATEKAAYKAGSSHRRTETAIAEIAPGQLGEHTDIVQRIPLINFSDASDVDNAISRSEHSLPIWVRPGKPRTPVYSIDAFGLLMDTDAFAPAIPKDSVLVIEPNTDSGHNDWCFLVLSGNRTAIAKAYPGLTATDLTIQAVGNERAPISEWPEGAQLKGFVKNVLFP